MFSDVINGGDSITLVSEILNITPLEAINFLNTNLGLGLNINGKQRYNYNAINTYQNKRKAKQMHEKWKKETCCNLCDYLQKIQKNYNQKCKQYTSIEQADDFFNDKDVIEYCNEIDKMEYYFNFFIYGTEKDLIWLKKTKGKVVNS